MNTDPIEIMEKIEKTHNTIRQESDWVTLRSSIEKLQEELSKISEWNQEMVKKAASNGTLEGYREMGRKLADQEEKIDQQDSELKRLAEYDNLLTEEMPDDYKDWHQNSKSEWPELAVLTIRNLRERENWALNQLEKTQNRLKELKDLFREGFDSEDNHDLDEWETRAKKFIGY